MGNKLVEALRSFVQPKTEEERKLIEKLSRISTIGRLRQMFKSKRLDQLQLTHLVEERVVEILPGILPRISSFEELQEMWIDFMDSLPCRLIEKRMEEVVANTSDLQCLDEMEQMLWDGTRPYYIVHERIQEILSGISDPVELFGEYVNVLSPRYYIENRMLDVIGSVSPNAVPKWLIPLLELEEYIPSCVRAALHMKIKELLDTP